MEEVEVYFSEAKLRGQTVRPEISRKINKGDIVLLTRFTRNSSTAPPILGVFDTANGGSGIETMYFAAEAMFEIGERKIGQQRIPLIRGYKTGRPIEGNPPALEIKGSSVFGLYVGKEEVAQQLRKMDLLSIADLVERMQSPYFDAYR